MFVEFVLAGWSSAGIGWLLLAQQLVKRDAEKAPRLVKATGARRTETLSIFKPLPPLGPGGLRAEAAGLESFIAQLDAESELLLGIHEADRGAVAPFLEAMRARYPEARLKPIFRAEPDEVANPKIAWEKFLAPHAGGDLWLWSDADIIVPRRFLRSARAEFAQYGAGMLTFPYVVRKMSSGPALFDALFVNVELYPGVLLLRERGPVDFGLGAAMLFRRDDFQRRIDWQELGGALADDFMLGQRLGPVRVSVTTLETVADADTWREALLHYLRWSKTVAWNRPAGSAARVVVLPVLGWLLYAAFHPGSIAAWAGCVAMIQLDVVAAAMICRRVGCTWRPIDWLAAEGWSLWRIVAWAFCWLPVPVVWRGQRWHGPRSTPGAVTQAENLATTSS